MSKSVWISHTWCGISDKDHISEIDDPFAVYQTHTAYVECGFVPVVLHLISLILVEEYSGWDIFPLHI